MTRLDAVKIDDEGVPQGFHFRHQFHRVTHILDFWKDVGEWWREDEELWFWRVQTHDLGVYELALGLQETRWYLYKIYD